MSRNDFLLKNDQSLLFRNSITIPKFKHIIHTDNIKKRMNSDSTINRANAIWQKHIKAYQHNKS